MFYGSIPALITPFAKGGESIDYQQVQTLIEMHVREKSDALVICGTTGEGPTYSEDEYKQVVETCVKASNGQIDIIVNSGTNDTKKSVQRTQFAKVNGASCVLAIIPYYNKPNFIGIVKHFESIARVGMSVIVYHHPGRTGISLSAEQLATLHKIDGVVGIKEASDDPSLTGRICAVMPEAVIFSGNDHLAIDVVKRGGKGSISVIANIAPLIWHNLMCDVSRGDLFEEVRPLIDAINLEVNPQGIKCAMAQAGLCENSLRLPLVPVSLDTERKIAAANLFCMDAL